MRSTSTAARLQYLAIPLYLSFAITFTTSLFSQDLAPRAYVITPVNTNAIVLNYSYFTGNLNFEGTVPITGATAQVSVPVVSYYHSMRLFNRSANFNVSLPYGVGNFHGNVVGAETNAYRSGLLDSVYRLSINLYGGPAMNVAEIRKWKQKTIVGASLRVVAPTGQYDSTKLINYGGNRWAFKPEIGVSRRWKNWILDAYAGAWFYTTNPRFFSQNIYNPGINVQTQEPVTSFEGHLSYDVKPRLWVSLDGNFWFGGTTSLNGVRNPNTTLRNSRVGATASLPLNRHQSVKVTFNRGAYIKFGGNYNNLSLGWQYSWIGKRF